MNFDATYVAGDVIKTEIYNTSLGRQEQKARPEVSWDLLLALVVGTVGAATFAVWPQVYQAVANMAVGIVIASWVMALIFMRVNTTTRLAFVVQWNVIGAIVTVGSAYCAWLLLHSGTTRGLATDKLLKQTSTMRMVPALRRAVDIGGAEAFILLVSKAATVFTLLLWSVRTIRPLLGVTAASVGMSRPSGFAARVAKRWFPKGRPPIFWATLTLAFCYTYASGLLVAGCRAVVDGRLTGWEQQAITAIRNFIGA